jgi:hypothetical protein
VSMKKYSSELTFARLCLKDKTSWYQIAKRQNEIVGRAAQDQFSFKNYISSMGALRSIFLGAMALAF